MKPQIIFNTLDQMARAIEPVSHSRHVAAITYRNDVLAFGINQKRSHPFQKRFGKTEDSIFLHAETDALQTVIRKHGAEILAKCDIYVLRMKYINSYKTEMVRGSSKPCIGCARALATFKIKNVYYTLNHGCESEWECL